MDHEQRIAIDAPAEVVWAVLSDVERWPDWTGSVSAVELLDGSLVAGNRVRIRQPKFPAVVWKVAEVNPPSSFTWEARSAGSRAIARHTIIDNGDGTSTAVLGISQTGPLGALVALASRPITKRYVSLEAKGLKERSEQQATGG